MMMRAILQHTDTWQVFFSLSPHHTAKEIETVIRGFNGSDDGGATI
jgi:hypothetical protein